MTTPIFASRIGDRVTFRALYPTDRAFIFRDCGTREAVVTALLPDQGWPPVVEVRDETGEEWEVSELALEWIDE